MKNKIEDISDVLKNALFLKGSTIKDCTIILWPPIGESDIKNIIVAINFLVEKKGEIKKGFTFDTSSNGWTSIIRNEVIPNNNIYNFRDFDAILENLMKTNSENFFDYHNYYFKVGQGENSLGAFINKTIVEISFLNIGTNHFNPFGIKLKVNSGQTLFSFASTYGNYIQTSDFLNYYNPLEFNSKLGNTIEIPLSKLC